MDFLFHSLAPHPGKFNAQASRNPRWSAGRASPVGVCRSAWQTGGGVFNRTPTSISFGDDSFCDLGLVVAGLGAARCLLVTTSGRSKLASYAQMQIVIPSTIFAGAVSQVPRSAVDSAEQALDDHDLVIAIGGGAAIGLAKALALRTGVPYVAVPTTYSGSEMTAFCGMTVDGQKQMFADVRMLATAVLYDPKLTSTLPRSTSVASAINALAHCIDVMYAPTALPVAHLAAVEGARVLMSVLREPLVEPLSPETRQQLLFGAHLAGSALSGGFGLHHVLAHVLGGSFGIPHAVAHAVLLPYTTSLLTSLVPAAMRPIETATGTGSLGPKILDIIRRADLPSTLARAGMAASDLGRVVDLTMVSLTTHGELGVDVSVEMVRQVVDGSFRQRLPT